MSFKTESTPATFADRKMEKLLRVRSSTARCHRKALDRLRSILEGDEQRGARTSVSGGARKPASGFRL